MSLAAPAVFGSGRAMYIHRTGVLRVTFLHDAGRPSSTPWKNGEKNYSSIRLRVLEESTLMPGPIVVEMTTDLTYLPLALEGFTRRSSLMSAP